MRHRPAAGDGRGFMARGACQQHPPRGAQAMTKRKSTKRTDVAVLPAQGPTVLLTDVRELIVQAREGVARAVDSGLTTLYWHVGRRIRQDILKEKRAEDGEGVVSALRGQ